MIKLIMEIETTVEKIGGSYFVRIPAEMAKFFKLNINNKNKAKIKDISNSEVKVSFELW